MTASFRSQRVLQRLTASPLHRPTPTFRPNRQFLVHNLNPSTSCISSQHRLSSDKPYLKPFVDPATAPPTTPSKPPPKSSTTTTTKPSPKSSSNKPRPSSSSSSSSPRPKPKPKPKRKSDEPMITYPGIDHTPIPEPETPLDTIDFSTHYTLFRNSLTEGYPPHGTFNIDLDSLKKEYIELQGKTHPDRYPRGPLKRRAEALSAHVGSAYRTMADPLLRAQYVLKEYHYIDLTSEKSSRTERLDPELLMEVMDVQEAIEAVGGEGGEGDRAEMEMEIEGIKRENEARIRDCVEAIATAFRRTGFDLKEAKEQTVRLKFWYSVQQALKDWEPGMGGIKLVH